MGIVSNQQRLEEEDYVSLRLDSNEVIERASDFLSQRIRSQSEFFTEKSKDESRQSRETRPYFLGEIENELSNVIRYNAPYRREERPSVSIVAVQEWEGYVEQIEETYFSGLMYDVSSGQRRPSEAMDIPISLVDPEDLQLLQKGSIFRLVIGRERRRGGPLQNKTLLYFRKSRFEPRAQNSKPLSEMMAQWK